MHKAVSTMNVNELITEGHKSNRQFHRIYVESKKWRQRDSKFRTRHKLKESSIRKLNEGK